MKKHGTVVNLLIAAVYFFGFNIVVCGQQAHQDDFFTGKAKDVKLSKAELVKKSKMQINLFSEKKNKIKGIQKYDQPDKFAEFQKMIRTRDGESMPAYKTGYQTVELNKAMLNRPMGKANASLNWVERGPGNVSGRTRGIIVDSRASDNRTWFAGSVGGGIWKTTDAGLSWVNKTPLLSNLATTVLVQSASNPNIMYCGTGEGFFNADAVNGGGIFKSVDGGNTWTLLASTAVSAFRNVNRIIIDPVQPNIVLAATNEGLSGIHRSVDGGATWTRVFSSNFRVQDLRATPGNFSVQYAAVNSAGVYKSTDAGLTWSPASVDLPAGNRYEICVSPKNPQVLYASIEIGSSSALAYSDNAAASWSTVSVASGTLPNWLNGQGWYDNTIEAHPYNSNIAMFGGIDLWKSELTGGQATTTGLKSIVETNTTSFLNFVNWGGPWRDGGIGKGTDFFNFAPFNTSMFLLTDDEYVAVELRFGPGKSQKAHRFVNVSGTYQYRDYVNVPFEVWDVKNNRQIMASFRDWKDDGVFDLITYNSSNIGREYLAINAVPYDAAAPNPNIAVTNGIAYKNIFSMWPILASGTWNASALPVSTLKINWGTTVIKYAAFTPMTDGYSQYGKPYVHVDHHSIVVVPVNETANSFWIVNGNDGGVAVSTDGGTGWREALSGGYNTTQFYGVDKKHGANEYFGGTQDNGTWKSPAGVSASSVSAYSKPIGGDGFDVAWHYTNGNKLIGGSQYNNFWKTTNGGTNWYSGMNNLADVGSGKGQFISKIAESNSDPDLIFTTGSQGVWRSEDFGDYWSNIAIIGWNFNSLSTPVAISIAEPQNVWAGSSLSNYSSSLFVSTDGGLSFSPVSNLGSGMGTITAIDTHPTEPNTAFITYSYSGYGKIYKTTNLGQSWQDITMFSNGTSSNGFPNVATFCVLVMPFNTNQIWAGTEIGLMETIDGGATWHLADNGLQAVCIWDMKIVDDQVIVATHGRGIFSVTLPQLSGYQPPVVTLSPIISSVTQSLAGTIDVNTNLRSAYDSTKVFINGTAFYRALNTTAGSVTFSVPIALSGDVTVQTIGYKLGRQYKSSARVLSLLAFKPIQTTYVNNFNTPSTDFSGPDFSITKPVGFQTNAIHSVHPYTTSTNYIYTLLVPIRVASANSFVEYDDIAVVEPGDPGTVFGDEAFWDYVVVEGSKDGSTWIPIENGYDCQLDTRWQAIWGTSTNPDSTYFVHHKVNLLSKFAAGDQIIIRFRMYSDAAAVGWGWAIDNIAIQQGAVGVEKEKGVPSKYALMQNYPNPFNPATNIKFSLPKSENVKLQIFDSIGRLIETIIDTHLEAGYYSYRWKASHYASGVYVYRLTAGSYTESKKLNLLK